ncbi:GNAT family N-acetyltransferase [Micromonospora sp. WMMD710]|uniref:GNAT family N-acetyltransferase n=1 Tax=Micromonospora sp. WMMD710 TaxID=3016085 RepID=UPI002415FB0C|nr:GNAT family N-acetyltransferase [Micromonospora sp. WMMD710]MDG4759130.1 GNAT family N-acetyltransferase [Micromonospora sp. WMMD710]
MTNASGLRFLLRRATADCLDLVNRFHRQDCSLQSRAARYHGPRDRIRVAEWRMLTRVEGGYTVLISRPGENDLVGLAHLLWQASAPPEVALLIADAWQGLGVGRAVGERLRELAAAHGHPVLRACVQPENIRAIRLARRFGLDLDDSAEQV